MSFSRVSKKEEQADSNRLLYVRNVTGCGKNRGLQLVLDSQKMGLLLPKQYLTKGFKVNLSNIIIISWLQDNILL